MLLPNAAVILLGALQPALGTPAPGEPASSSRLRDGTKNQVTVQRVFSNKTEISYFAPNPGCGPYRAWVGIWSADACNPYSADFKAWSYVEPTKDSDVRSSIVEFNNAELGVGEWKAAFVCEDGRRQPWMVSKTFKIDEAPPAQDGQCVHRRDNVDTEWGYTPCDQVYRNLCFDCTLTCDACEYCKQQCGQAGIGRPF